ncbi:MAG: hypothetical protein R2942_10255 [Ignavibacteria bacterium]
MEEIIIFVQRLMHAMESSNVLFEIEEQHNLNYYTNGLKEQKTEHGWDIDFPLNEEVSIV